MDDFENKTEPIVAKYIQMWKIKTRPLFKATPSDVITNTL